MRFRGSPQGTPRNSITEHNNQSSLAPPTAIRPAYSWWPTASNKKKDDDEDNNNRPTVNQTEAALRSVLFGNHHSSATTKPTIIPIMDSGNQNSNGDSAQPVIPKFSFGELTLGLMVGQGGFSDVRDIVSVHLDEALNATEEETKLRKDIEQGANLKGSFKKHYVLKKLRNDLHEDEHTKGILDLAIEAEFLTTLQHDNIISLRGIADTDPHEDRFFVVLDRLGITLERKFNMWRKIAQDSTGLYLPCCGYCCSKATILHSLWKERLEVCLQTAKAIEYLHGKGIVFRDLKPDNIGFDSETNLVKLFDFGLAKRLTDAEKAPDNGNPQFHGLYHLTGNTGSLRYMAPEVAQCLPYDLSVDAYSFGILFWQICSLQTPYARFSTRMHAERVVRQGQRPKPDSSWPATWVQLQQSCWSSDRAVRPQFTTVVEQLQEQLEFMEQEVNVIPSRVSEIKARKKKKKVASASLDRDTRKAPEANELANSKEAHVEKRFDNDVV